MKATKNLEDDHVHILKLIDVMEQITRTKDPQIEHIELIVEIIRNFADGVHHAKEENLFFPFLTDRGFSVTHGPVAVMLNEHVQGRNFVKGISDNIILFKSGFKAALNGVFLNMNGYIELLRAHISKENNVLFRMADSVLSETDNQTLLEKFAEAEKSQVPSYNSKGYPEQIKELASQYDI